MKTTRSCVIFIVACVFVSCFHGPVNHEEKKELWGWQSTGLVPDPEQVQKDGSGIYRVTHVGNRLFVMDSKTAKGGKRAYQMFTSLQGSKKWDSLALPSGVSPYTWIADTGALYIGADTLGELWRYVPASNDWKKILEFKPFYAIEGLGFYKGRIVASLASSTLMHWPILIQDGKGGWVNTIEESDTSRFSFMEAIENEGKFYAASWNQSIWSFTDAEGWKMIPGPPSDLGEGSTERLPRSLAVVDGNLFVGYLNVGGVVQYSNGAWNRVDSAVYHFFDNGATRQRITKTPASTLALLEWKGRLIAAGWYGTNPIVWGGPEEPKAWRKIGKDTWCKNFECFGGQTSDLTIVNDTLYAAAWSGLWKYPLDQMDSSIKLDSGYPAPQSSSSLGE